MQPVEYAALAARGQASEEHSANIRARVLAARERQYARQGADVCNAAIPPPQLAEHCPLSAGCVSYVCGRISATGADRPCA